MNYLIRRAGLVVAVCAAWQTLLPAAEKLTLKKVIEKVRANEQLYRNISLTVEEKYRYEGPVNAAIQKKKAKVTSSDTKIRVIFAGDRFHYRANRSVDEKGRTSKSSSVAAYDGKVTKILHRLSNGDWASVHQSRHTEWALLTPNTILFTSANWPKPLSAFLQERDVPGTRHHWRVLGKEKVDKLDCVKLEFESVTEDTGKVFSRSIFWLAMDRNFQTMKYAGYRPWNNRKLPHATGRVKKFIRLMPNVWLPERTEIVVYDHNALKKGKQVVTYRKYFTVRKAKLDPKVKDSRFESVKFPKGAHVLVYRGDKVVKSYRQK